MNNSLNSTLICLNAIINENKSIAALSEKFKDDKLAQSLIYETCRYYYHLSFFLDRLLERSPKDLKVDLILRLGLIQLYRLNIAEHAVVNETVKLCQTNKKIWAKGFVNGVLRNFIRQKSDLLMQLESNKTANIGLQDWLFKKIHQQWPEATNSIANTFLQHPPMILRVNQQKVTAAEYLAILTKHHIKAELIENIPEAIHVFEPISITQLPFFDKGYCSIQDCSAQLAVNLLPIQKGASVLDACAAPGGKACHLLEKHPSIQLDAVDINAKRLKRVNDNLSRLQLSANVFSHDVTKPMDKQYDAILLDAPCSATGVIKRNPDIRLHRTEQDIKNVSGTQIKILSNLWQHLKPNGSLLYITCSILREENDDVIAKFMTQHQNIELMAIHHLNAIQTDHGIQILPNTLFDGFYYSLLRKIPQ